MYKSDDYVSLLRRKCKVCSSPHREKIDLMLMGKDCHEDGERFTYDEIVDWCAANGLTLSKASLSRHKTDHLMPDVLASIEVQQQVDAIAQATGKTLGLEAAFLNMLISKAMKALDGKDVNLEQKGAIGGIVRAIEALLKVKKAEVAFSQERLEEADKAITETAKSKGLDEETISTIREQIYGLVQ